ncbi:capsid scaffold protein [Colobine gammaherpesvirus 1]|nr:capsid scaffold protein [Colobine gammaherpesvirus 1]QDQ69225.1 capsid scaffold protein [Colobine gammaherpesvirus 1]
MNSAGADELISLPKAAFLSLVQSSIEGMKQTASRVPQTMAPPMMAGYGCATVQPELTVAAYAPPPAPQYSYSFRPQMEGGYYAFPNAIHRPHKRKRDDEDSTDNVFPGEEPAIHRDILSMSKSISEIQSELRELKQHTLQPRWSHTHTGAYDPRFAHPATAAHINPTGIDYMDHGYGYGYEYGYPAYTTTPLHPPPQQPPPHPTLAPPPPATMVTRPLPLVLPQPPSRNSTSVPSPPSDAQTDAAQSVATTVTHLTPNKTHNEPVQRQGCHLTPASTSTTVNASSRQNTESRIQQMFREELLAKQ